MFLKNKVLFGYFLLLIDAKGYRSAQMVKLKALLWPRTVLTVVKKGHFKRRERQPLPAPRPLFPPH